eukprot:GHVT01059691.1.p1 GENE.GHVT01059691.1~~GHVT01059691.1.p1  ORF type:complete len:326 (+),score=9.93 GHVT01059691.1:3418-4395(+)
MYFSVGVCVTDLDNYFIMVFWSSRQPPRERIPEPDSASYNPYTSQSNHPPLNSCRIVCVPDAPQPGCSIQPSATSTSNSPSKELAECSICFEDLCSKTLGYFRCENVRTCRHLFHYRCSLNIARSTKLEHRCPLCRAPFDKVEPVPDPSVDPAAWLRAVDLNGDGRLAPTEVLAILTATVNVDPETIEKLLMTHWKKWCTDGSDGINITELIVPETGLIAFIRANAPPRTSHASPPDMRLSPDQWFDFWDSDQSGNLDRAEVLRALIKTFNCEGASDADLARIEMLRTLIDALWSEFDPNGNGAIERREFCRNDGLAETITANIR